MYILNKVILHWNKSCDTCRKNILCSKVHFSHRMHGCFFFPEGKSNKVKKFKYIKYFPSSIATINNNNNGCKIINI